MAPVSSSFPKLFNIRSFIEGSNQLLSENPQMASIVGSRLPGHDKRLRGVRSLGRGGTDVHVLGPPLSDLNLQLNN